MSAFGRSTFTFLNTCTQGPPFSCPAFSVDPFRGRSSAFVNAAQSRLSTSQFAFDSRLILSPTGRPPSCHVTTADVRQFPSLYDRSPTHTLTRAVFLLRNIHICLIVPCEIVHFLPFRTPQTRNLLSGDYRSVTKRQRRVIDVVGD